MKHIKIVCLTSLALAATISYASQEPKHVTARPKVKQYGPVRPRRKRINKAHKLLGSQFHGPFRVIESVQKNNTVPPESIVLPPISCPLDDPRVQHEDETPNNTRGYNARTYGNKNGYRCSFPHGLGNIAVIGIGEYMRRVNESIDRDLQGDDDPPTIICLEAGEFKYQSPQPDPQPSESAEKIEFLVVE